jgi:hypothetical protein
MITSRKLGFWSAILTAVFAVLFMGVGFFGTAYDGKILYPFIITAINPIDYAVWIPGLLLAPTFVILMACIHDQAPRDKKVFSQIGLSFALIYAALIMSDYFVQLTAVLPSITSNETGDLSFFSMYNPHGLFIALESLGYLMMNAALLSIAMVFTKSTRLERTIRWTFVIGFILAIMSFIALTAAGYPIVVFEVAIITIDVAVLIISGLSLRLYFAGAGNDFQSVPDQ